MPDGLEAGSSLDGYSSEGSARGKICYQELKSRGEGQGAGYLKKVVCWDPTDRTGVQFSGLGVAAGPMLQNTASRIGTHGALFSAEPLKAYRNLNAAKSLSSNT
jgi:hypothetical protein